MAAKAKKKIEEKSVSKPKPVPEEKKAFALIDSKAILELLKMPYRIELVSMEFPVENDKVKITLKGDPLPVKPYKKGQAIPEVTYKILRHWHNASITAKEE